MTGTLRAEHRRSMVTALGAFTKPLRERAILMRVRIRDRGALLAVSSSALSAYARNAGWHRQEPYRVHSDVYVGEDRPEIIVPRTERLGDYANVVATLIRSAGRDDRREGGDRRAARQCRSQVRS